jgi:acyl carrier protein
MAREWRIALKRSNNYSTHNMEVKDIIANLKSQIIEQLNLEEIKPDDIDPNAPLFGDGLGLDSIDALELIVLLEKNYGIKIQDPKEAKSVFASVTTMADYIAANAK